MNQSIRGWALIEVLLAIALVAMQSVIWVRLNHVSQMSLVQSLHDTQVLGLALEVTAESHSTGDPVAALEGHAQTRLRAIRPGYQWRWSYGDEGLAIEMGVGEHDGTITRRWRLPMQPTP